MEPEVGQVPKNGPKSSAGNKTRNILQEDCRWLHFANDACDLRPDPSLVGLALLGTGEGEGLARESRNHDIHESRPREAVKGSKVIPDRRFSQGTVRHARSQYCSGIRLPLDVNNGCSGKTHLDSRNTGT
jgi:hypothetical protein